MDPSAIVLLNRAIAVSKVHGAAQALDELEKIKDSPAWRTTTILFHAGRIHIQTNDFKKATHLLEKAMDLSQLMAEKELLKRKRDWCVEK